MARLGIDFGTTNTVVVSSDRGRYPVVPHVTDTAIGQVVRDVFPSLLAFDHETGDFLYGPDAERCCARPGGDQRYSVIRSIKRLLRDYVGGGRFGEDVYPGGFDTSVVLTGFGAALRASILRSGIFSDDEPLEAAITWPANANGAQRYVTRACLRDAGFQIIATLNEPTAASIEYADRAVLGNRIQARQLHATVVIFDFGGGTFDASLVHIEGTHFTVLDTAGIETLGGDDLDRVLAGLFAEALGVEFGALTLLQREMLLRHSCQQKESISSGTVRTLTLTPHDIGLPGTPVTVQVATYFERLTSVIAPAIKTVWGLATGAPAQAAGVTPETIDALYLVGGSSNLPLVRQLIASRFPSSRLVMTDKPFTATAMGAAIHSAETLTLRDILSRHFGVIRLADYGRREYFAPIFPAGQRLPGRGEPPVEISVEYTPRHNIGHLRYLECASVDPGGTPVLGVRNWSDVLFPYDSSIPVERMVTLDDIRQREDLACEAVSETYSCDADGVISVRLRRASDGKTRTYEIFRG